MEMKRETEDNDNVTNDVTDDVTDDVSSELMYSLNDKPPWHLCVLFAFQHCFLALGGSVGVPFILASFLCLGTDEYGLEVRSYLIGSVLVVNGISSFVQSTFGTRLPILQGSSFAFLVPAISILTLEHNTCPSLLPPSGVGNASSLPGNSSVPLYDELLPDGAYSTADDVWMRRVRELQGALIVASAIEVVIGATGLVGFLTKLFGPITITVTITLIGIQLVKVAPKHAKYHWGVAFFTAFVLVVSSQYMKNLKFPFPAYSRSKKLHITRTQPFKMFPVLIAIGLGWILCLILTVSGVLSDDPEDGIYQARADAKFSTVYNSMWFRVPYPFQWGWPIVTASGVVGMLTAILASVIESIGDYNACATMCDAPPLPKHAVNRGIMMEGFGCLLASMVGTTTGTTSYSENVAAIGITKVASRRVMQVAGLVGIVIGCFTKIGAFLVSIPEPVFGGIFMVVFGMIISIGLTNLSKVDLTSSRNIFVIGFSFYLGLMVPDCVKYNYFKIDTGHSELDSTIKVLLESSLTVGAFVATFIDNTLPGSKKERGMVQSEQSRKVDKKLQSKCYDPPMFECCSSFSSYLPFMPNPRSDKSENGENEITDDQQGTDNNAFEASPTSVV